MAYLLAAYDEQLRTDAETPSAVSVIRHGPLLLVTFAGGRGFVTYSGLHGADADGLDSAPALLMSSTPETPGGTRRARRGW